MKRRMFSLSMWVVTFAVLSSAGWAQQDPFIGTWKQNMAKSKYDPASVTPKAGTTVKREAAGANAYKVTTDGMNPQGATTHTEYTATLDGKDSPLKGSADYDSVSIKKTDANTLITVNRKGGTVVRMLRTVVSKDGKTSTSDQVGYNAQGSAFHNVTVFDKSDPAR